MPEADVQKFYEDNPSKFEHPERVRASHILLLTMNTRDQGPLTEDQMKAKRKLIDDIRKRAVGGEDFAALAKEFTEDPGSKDKGGEYIFGRGEMDPAFEAGGFCPEDQRNQRRHHQRLRLSHHQVERKSPGREDPLQ